MRKALIVTGGLIGLYVVVANATGFGRAVQAAGGVVNTGIRTLQGR